MVIKRFWHIKKSNRIGHIRCSLFALKTFLSKITQIPTACSKGTQPFHVTLS